MENENKEENVAAFPTILIPSSFFFFFAFAIALRIDVYKLKQKPRREIIFSYNIEYKESNLKGTKSF